MNKQLVRLSMFFFLICVVECGFMSILWTVDYGLWTASAEVPKLINYQGKLTDTAGNPVTDGAYAITFRIYDAETAGNLLWEETQSGVVIQKGVFAVLLGSVTPFTIAFDKPYWLAIKVGTDAEMSPRQKMSSAAFAIKAEKSENLVIPNQTQGDILYYNGTSWVRLEPGTPGQFLKTQGVGANPVYAPTTSYSNVIYQWSGYTGMRNNIHGIIHSTSLTEPQVVTPVYTYLRTECAQSYPNFMGKFKKIVGISTVTIYSRIWNDGDTTSLCKVTIGAVSTVITVPPSTTPTWYFSTLDISGLTNGTVYDITTSLYTSSGCGRNYMSDIVMFGG